MRPVALLALLTACGTDPVATTKADTDSVDTDPKADTDVEIETDTAVEWDTDLAVDTDTNEGGGGTLEDASVGVTPNDGPWSGTFKLVDDFPLYPAPALPNKHDGLCEGTVTMMVSGDKPEPRHIRIDGTCAEWTHNNPLGALAAKYEAVTLVGLGTIDAADTAKATLDLSVTAVGLGAHNFSNVPIEFAGDALEIKRSIQGGNGFLRLTVDLTKGEAPVDP